MVSKKTNDPSNQPAVHQKKSHTVPLHYIHLILMAGQLDKYFLNGFLENIQFSWSYLLR